MKRTYQASKVRRARTHGFLVRMKTRGGRAMDAKSANQLNDVYQEMRSEVGYEEVKKEVTAQWALYAFAFAFVASLGAVSMAARWP